MPTLLQEQHKEEATAIADFWKQGWGSEQIAQAVFPAQYTENPSAAKRKVMHRLESVKETVARHPAPQGPPADILAPYRGMKIPGWVEEENGLMGKVDYGLPEAEQSVENWLRLTGDRLVISDLHIPYHDNRAIEAAFRTAQRLGIRRFLVLGDTMDGNQWSKRGMLLGHQRRWQDDAIVGEKMFKAFLNVFEGGEVVNGNHDQWAVEHYRGMVDPEWILPRMFGTDNRIAYSQYEQCELVSGGETFRLLHGANYSSANPLSVPQKLATKFGCHVVTAHQHHACQGYDISGRYQAVALGCAADPSRLLYLHKSPRTNPVQTQGYAVIKDGWCRAYGPNDPDWR